MHLSPELIREIHSATDTQAAAALASLTTSPPSWVRSFTPARALAMLTVDENYLTRVDDDTRFQIEAFRHRLTNNAVSRALDPAPAGADVQLLTNHNGPSHLFNPHVRAGEYVQAPTALWAKGDVNLLTQPKAKLITITGARAHTGYGDQVATDITEGVASQGNTVVTSFAYGINEAVIKAALAADQPQIVYLAAGLNHIYPVGLSSLPDRILDQGGLILAAAPPDARPHRERFMAKNHHLALTSGTSIIVEGGIRSGSRIVVDVAAAARRHVGAVPGPVTSAGSALPNALLVNGTAKAVTSATDTLNLASSSDPRAKQQLETHTTLLRFADPSPEASMT